jgi:hypothetical protein
MRKGKEYRAQADRNQASIDEWRQEQTKLRIKSNPLRTEEAILSIPETAGGPYSQISAKTRKGFSEAHHIPPWDAYKDVIPLKQGEGPSIWMHKEDHYKTASHGGTNEEYWQVQRELITQGKFIDAFKRDVQDLKDAGLYEKYEKPILQAQRYLEKIALENPQKLLPKLPAKMP